MSDPSLPAFDPPAAANPATAAGRVPAAEMTLGRRVHPPRPAPRAVDACAVIAGIGFGACLALAVDAESSGALRAPGGLATAGGRVAGLAGAYLLLMLVLLTGRVPFLERTLGQDRLTRWHRLLAPWALGLIVLHGLLVVIGYAQAGHLSLTGQYWRLLRSYPGILASTVAFVLLMVAGVTSARIAARRMRYETWWAVHLYTFLALALAFSHQIHTGASFVGHPVNQALWTALYVAVGTTILISRVLLPAWRTVRHDLRVVAVQHEVPGVVSVVCEGRSLERLAVAGGQFFLWRVLTRGQWWQAHPYSMSALPEPPYLRFTARVRGDHGEMLTRLTPGTRVAIEGPYGAFTADQRRGDRVLLIGAGIGVTPLRSLIQDLPAHVDVTMIIRASRPEETLFADELRRILDDRGGRLIELTGPRRRITLDAASLRRHVPDVGRRDLYVCGPTGFTASLREAARALHIPDDRVHHETFAF